MAGKSETRIAVSSEVKKKLLPAIDHSHFLGYDEEDRIVLFTMAAALATRFRVKPKTVPFIGLVRMESIPEEELSELLLMHLASEGDEDLEGRIDDLGVSRRREVIANLNALANSGFTLLADRMKEPEENVIADMIAEMDDAYRRLQERCPELNLPKYRTYGDDS